MYLVTLWTREKWVVTYRSESYPDVCAIQEVGCIVLEVHDMVDCLICQLDSSILKEEK